VAEVEEELGALRQTLPPLELELNLRKTTSGARAWCPRRIPSQPRHAFTWRMARRCWGYRSTPPSTTRRWGPTWER